MGERKDENLYEQAMISIFLGDDPDNEIDDIKLMLRRMRGILMIGDEVDEFYEDDDDEEESEEDPTENGITKNEPQIYEPNLLELQIPPDQPKNQYLQTHPAMRTLMRQIWIRNSLFSGSSNNTRSSQSLKYPVYAFTDYHFAPTERVKIEYEKIIREVLLKHKKEKYFDEDYYDKLLTTFGVLNETQIKEHLHQNKETEILSEKMRRQKDLNQLTSDLTKYIKYTNETKDSYFILAQESINLNYYQLQLQCPGENPVLTEVSFCDELERRIFSKQIKLNKKRYEIETEEVGHETEVQKRQEVIEEELNQKKDNYFCAQFQANKYSPFEVQTKHFPEEHSIDMQQKVLIVPESYSNLPTQSSKAFRLWGTVEEPGKNLQRKIYEQLEIDRKNNDQLKEKVSDLIQLQQNEVDKKEQQFEEHINQYSYFNKEILDFCTGKQKNFLNQPFEMYNNVEIDLHNRQFFSEKLEIYLHVKKPPEIPRLIDTSKIGAPSIISKPGNTAVSNIGESVLDQDPENSSDPAPMPSLQPFMPGDMFDERYRVIQNLIQDKLKKYSHTSITIQNSVVAQSFLLNDFNQDVNKHAQYHRSSLLDILYLEKLNMLGLERKKVNHFDPWEIALHPIMSKNQKNQDVRELLLEELPEQLDSKEHYKQIKSLSLAKGNFILFEYIEQRPIVLSNTGMCMKAIRYVYGNRSLSQFKDLKREEKDFQLKIEKQFSEEELLQLEFKQMIVDKLGKIGQIRFLEDNDKLELHGQLDESYFGISIIENELYRAPVFRQKLPATDFLLVRQKEHEGYYRYVLRPIECIYLVGQIEPKIEVFTPHSRPLGNFTKNYLKTYIKKQFKENNDINFEDLHTMIFQKQGQQHIRSALKECQGEQDTSNQKIWRFKRSSPQEDEKKLHYDIQPKEVCLFESMLHSCYLLQEFGLQELRNSDKMKKTLQVYLTRHPSNFDDWVIARRIEDELNMTAWSLSESFQKSKNQQGRMLLYGIGDPTSGHGGISYIKKPLKARGEKSQNAVQEKKPQVMGTDKDLRKLLVDDIQNIVNKLGIQQTKVKRWPMINELAQKLQEIKNPDNQFKEEVIMFNKNLERLNPKEKHQLNVIEQFAAGQRQTTKKQKAEYQKELNSQLKYLIHNLTLTVDSQVFEGYSIIKSMRNRRRLANDDKNKDLEFQTADVEHYLIIDKENYKLSLQAFMKKEKKIWLEKKKKKGLL